MAEGRTGAKKVRQGCTPKCSDDSFRSECGGGLQVQRTVVGGRNVGLKVGIEVEGVAFKEVIWAMCRWRLLVKWKRYIVRKALKWIRHGEGFIWWDGEGEFEPDVWGIRV